jgi:hypothetical protein
VHAAFFAYLENKGLHEAHGTVLREKLSSQPEKALKDMVEELDSYLPMDDGLEASPFHFFSNSTYAGFPHPCIDFECRTDRMREMAYFAALYADRVIFPSPFGYLHQIEKQESLAAQLAFFLSRIVALRPLFDAGVLALASAQRGTICHACYAKLIGYSKSVFQAKLSKLEKEVEERYLDDVSYYIERWSGDTPFLVPRGPSSLVDDHHFGYRIDKTAPMELRRLASKIKQSVPLSKKQAKAYGVHSQMASHVVRDILNQNFYSTRFGTGYLTNRGVDLDVINALAPKDIQETNTLLKAHFAHELPVVGGISLDTLLKLRNNEGEAFRVYRDALTKAITQAKAEGPRKISQVFSDVVRPELNKIDIAMKSARATLVRDAIVDGAIASGFITVGLFSGIMPTNIGAIIAGLGGYHFAERVGKQLSNIGLEPEQVRNNNFYFLWKVVRHGNKTHGRTF